MYIKLHLIKKLLFILGFKPRNIHNNHIEDDNVYWFKNNKIYIVTIIYAFSFNIQDYFYESNDEMLYNLKFDIFSEQENNYLLNKLKKLKYDV